MFALGHKLMHYSILSKLCKLTHTEDKQKYLTLQVLFSFINFVVGRPIRIVDNIIIRMVRRIRTVIGPDKWKTFSGGM